MVREQGSDHSVLIPIDPWMRHQLTITEKFLSQNVTTPPDYPKGNLTYKSLWGGEMMYIRVARWCQIFKKNAESGQYDSVDIKSLGRGTYSIMVEMPYLYIGPHKNGEDVSLTLRVVQITFDPEVPKPMLRDIPTISTKASGVKGRRRKHAPKTHEDDATVLPNSI